MKTRAERLLLAAMLVLAAHAPGVHAKGCQEWPQWQTFRADFMTADGRIIDHTTAEKITTSEGQAYAMLFALIAGDKASFARLLEWTNHNLAESRLGERLPAWRWGRSRNGNWEIIDDNAAADADLWMIYALAEAARLWQRPDYRNVAEKLAHAVLEQEVAFLPGLGQTLLPGPQGFDDGAGQWRLNPSYTPLPVMRYLAGHFPQTKWQAVLRSSHRIVIESAPKGFAADWVGYSSRRGFIPDQVTQGVGSYDAIRVYLWAGVTHVDDPLRRDLLSRLLPLREHVESHGLPPRQIDTHTTRTRGVGPVGFSAALLPFLASHGSREGMVSQLSRLLEHPLSGQALNYYDQVLGLFGLGWLHKRYRFTANGELTLPRAAACVHD